MVGLLFQTFLIGRTELAVIFDFISFTLPSRPPLYQHLTHLVFEKARLDGIEPRKKLLDFSVFVNPAGYEIQGKGLIC
jgi:hypothetical protein